tara:strand:- start:59 stop:529 length:471 start_codon:yes stop_codon:yes gene_type:complete
MQTSIDYKKIMQAASLDAIKSILTTASADGLPGQHHFYITFDMTNDGVEISETLREKYPSEMTIVIQNWYQGFTVEETAFFITLNFSNVPEKMRIPFSAIKSFVDPSVEFGIEFEYFETKREAIESKLDESSEELQNREAEVKGGEVINIDNFRKS